LSGAGRVVCALRIVNAHNGVARQHKRMLRLSNLALVLLLAACTQDVAEQPPTESAHGLATKGETQRLLQAISTSRAVDQRDACYRTPLMLAAQYGHLETVTQLLRAGARVNLHEKGYYTALMLAAGNGHTEVVRALAAAGASIDEVEITRGWTALIWAAKRGHLDTARLLLELGADAAVRDQQGRSARDWAEAQRHPEIAALL
jgi:ankyrin repeat protein